MKKISVLSLGLTDYESTRLRQKDLRQALIDGGNEYLISCNHNQVITYGKSQKLKNLLSSTSEYRIIEVERGGDITCHEPGQLIIYPIINLNNHKKDVAWYMRKLEQVIIDSLQKIGLKSQRINGKTGVWVSETEKIASIGVSLSRWCTMHGLAINHSNSMEGFKYITPCGLPGIKMVKITDYHGISYNDFEEIIIKEFIGRFGYN